MAHMCFCLSRRQPMYGILPPVTQCGWRLPLYWFGALCISPLLPLLMFVIANFSDKAQREEAIYDGLPDYAKAVLPPPIKATRDPEYVANEARVDESFGFLLHTICEGLPQGILQVFHLLVFFSCIIVLIS
jgi:hypothetical protein